MDLFTTIIKSLTDKTTKLSHKFLMLFALVISVIIIDNTLSFSKNYNNTKKTNQIEKLNNIIKDSTLTKSEIKQLKELRSNIISHKTLKDHIYDKYLSIKFKNEKTNTSKYEADIKTRNYTVHFITSNWLLLLLMIVMVFVPFFSNEGSFNTMLLGVIFLEFVFFGLAWLCAKILSLLPVIYGNPNLNYILNGLISIGIFALLFRYFNKHNKKE